MINNHYSSYASNITRFDILKEEFYELYLTLVTISFNFNDLQTIVNIATIPGFSNAFYVTYSYDSTSYNYYAIV